MMHQQLAGVAIVGPSIPASQSDNQNSVSQNNEQQQPQNQRNPNLNRNADLQGTGVVVQSFLDLQQRMELGASNRQIIINSSNFDVWIQYRKFRINIIRSELKQLLLYIIIYLVFTLITFIQLFLDIYQPLYGPLIFIGFNIYSIVIAFKMYCKKYEENDHTIPPTTFSTMKICIDNVFCIIFNLLLFIYSFDIYGEQEEENGTGGGMIRAWQLCFPLVGSMFTFVFLTKWPTNSCNSTMHLVKIGGVLLKSLLICTIVIRVSDLTNWDSVTIFWAYWCSISIQVVIVFFCFVLTIMVLIKLCSKSINCQNAFGSIWAFILCAGFLGTGINAVTSYISYKEDHLLEAATKKEYQFFLMKCFVPLIGYFSLIFAITIIFRQNLRQVTYLCKTVLISFWFEKMLYFDDIIIQDIEEDEQARRRQVESRIRTTKFQRPWLLKRLTNTYFRKSKQDYSHFQAKVRRLRDKYLSKANRLSVNLQQILDKNKGKRQFFTDQDRYSQVHAINETQNQNQTSNNNINITTDDHSVIQILPKNELRSSDLFQKQPGVQGFLRKKVRVQPQKHHQVAFSLMSPSIFRDHIIRGNNINNVSNNNRNSSGIQDNNLEQQININQLAIRNNMRQKLIKDCNNVAAQSSPHVTISQDHPNNNNNFGLNSIKQQLNDASQSEKDQILLKILRQDDKMFTDKLNKIAHNHRHIGSIAGDPRQGTPFLLQNSDNSCLICFQNQCDAVLMNCGHGGICYKCACELLKSTQVCHLCRQKFMKVMQLDMNGAEFNYIKVKAMTYLVDQQGDESESLKMSDDDHDDDDEDDDVDNRSQILDSPYRHNINSNNHNNELLFHDRQQQSFSQDHYGNTSEVGNISYLDQTDASGNLIRRGIRQYNNINHDRRDSMLRRNTRISKRNSIGCGGNNYINNQQQRRGFMTNAQQLERNNLQMSSIHRQAQLHPINEQQFFQRNQSSQDNGQRYYPVKLPEQLLNKSPYIEEEEKKVRNDPIVSDQNYQNTYSSVNKVYSNFPTQLQCYLDSNHKKQSNFALNSAGVGDYFSINNKDVNYSTHTKDKQIRYSSHHLSIKNYQSQNKRLKLKNSVNIGNSSNSNFPRSPKVISSSSRNKNKKDKTVMSIVRNQSSVYNSQASSQIGEIRFPQNQADGDIFFDTNTKKIYLTSGRIQNLASIKNSLNCQDYQQLNINQSLENHSIPLLNSKGQMIQITNNNTQSILRSLGDTGLFKKIIGINDNEIEGEEEEKEVEKDIVDNDGDGEVNKCANDGAMLIMQNQDQVGQEQEEYEQEDEIEEGKEEQEELVAEGNDLEEEQQEDLNFRKNDEYKDQPLQVNNEFSNDIQLDSERGNKLMTNLKGISSNLDQ